MTEGFRAVEQIRLHQPTATPPRDAPRQRGRIRRQVRACALCNLRPGCREPVPWEGPSGAPFAVVGEAPGPEEDGRGRPFVGPSGRLLRALLDDVGFPPDDLFYLNTVSCWPNVARQTRPPTEMEQGHCRGNLLDQLALANTRYVLLVGGTALGSFRSDLKVTQHHGRIYVWLGRFVVMPTIHPAAVLRNRSLKHGLKEDLERWADIVREDDPLQHISQTCLKCTLPADQYDPNGVGYCVVHWARYGMKVYEKEMRRWEKVRWVNEELFDPRGFEVKKTRKVGKKMPS